MMKNIIRKFPCKDCILLVCCSSLCDNLLVSVNSFITQEGKCPDCGTSEFFKGSGPYKGSTLFKCSLCGHYFIYQLDMFFSRLSCVEGRKLKVSIEKVKIYDRYISR